MSTLTEFTLTLSLRREEEENKLWTVFHFATVREFTSFQYQIQIDDRLNLATREIDIRIQGVRVPSDLMPGSGVAVREIAYPNFEGEYRVNVAGAKKSESFTLMMDSEEIRLLERSNPEGIALSIKKGVEIIRA